MADEIDLANDLIDGEVSRALSKMRANAAKKSTSSKVCLACGEEIPKERQKLGYSLCVPCASEGERRRSLFIDD